MLTSTVHVRRQNLFKISTRDAHLHLSTRDAHLHLSALDKISHPSDSTPEQTRAPILGHPSDSIKEKLGPRHRSHPGKNSGPDAWASFRPGGYSGPGIRAQVPPGRKLGPRCSGPNSLGIDLPCPRQSSCPCAPISPSLCHLPGFTMLQLPPLVCRYRLGLTSIASCCRSLRESSWGFPPYLAPKSSLATRWPDATESSVGIAQRM